MTEPRLPLARLALVTCIVFAAAAISGGAVAALAVFAMMSHTVTVFGAPTALAGALAFALCYLVWRRCPPIFGALIGYAASAGWLIALDSPGTPALLFALIGAPAGLIAAWIGRAAIRSMGYPA